MPDTTNQINVCGDAIVNTTVFPDTKLQTLDRRVGKDQLYFDRKLFEQSVSDWVGIPIIYQKDGVHPTDFAAVNRDPVSAAEAIDGKCVGSVSNPRVVVPGGARLMAELDIDDNEDEIVSLWQQGRLFPSTAFTANSDGDRLTSPPIPNHVLLFPIEVDKVLPGDYGAFVNTLEVLPMKKSNDAKKSLNAEIPADDKKQDAMTPEVTAPTPAPATVQEPAEAAEVEEVKQDVEAVKDDVAQEQSELDQLRAELDLLKQEVTALKEKPEAPAPASAPATADVANADVVADDEPETTDAPATEEAPAKADDADAPADAETAQDAVRTLDDEIKWRDDAIAELKADLEALTAENDGLKAAKTALEEKIAGIEKEAAEAEFNSIVEKLPVGMKATPEQVEALHTQYVAGDMKALLHTVLNANASTGATHKVGQPFTQSNKVSQQIGVGDLSKFRKHN